MRFFLTRNPLRLVVFAAGLDVLYFALQYFAGPAIADLDISYELAERLLDFITVVGLLATMSFWVAMAAVVALLEAIYRRSVAASAGQEDQHRGE